MSYLNQNIPKRITFTGEALAIVQSDPFLSTAMAENGYPAEQLAIGETFQQAARATWVIQETEFVGRLEASESVQELEKTLRAFVVADRKIVQVALRAFPKRYAQLRMARRLQRNRANLLQQINNIYEEVLAHADILAGLESFGLTAAVINDRLQLVDDFAEAMQVQQRQTAEAEIATRRRQEAMQALDDWMRDFLDTARFVFRNDPRQLKKIGIPVR